MHVRAQTKHEVQGIVFRPLRQDCIEAQIWGRVQKNFCSIEGSQKHVVSLMEEVWNNQDSPRAGLLAKLRNWWRRALSRLVTKNPMVTLVELHDHICRWEKPTEGQTSLQHPTDLVFMAVWPNSIHSSVKTHENTLGICKKKKASKLCSDYEKQDSLVWWTSILSIILKKEALLVTCRVPSQSKVCW